MKGRILLQVEDKGQAYYVDPETAQRAFLGRPSDAFKVMRELGVGISEKDYNNFLDGAPERLAGKILLRIEAKGEAYYVSPIDLKLYYLGRPADAFDVMKGQGLGITNKDLNDVPVFKRYMERVEENENAIEELSEKIGDLQKETDNLKKDENVSESVDEKERNENAATPAIPSTGNSGGGGGGSSPATPAVPANRDTVAPVITDITVTENGLTSMAVSWITDEDSTSVVKYGATTTVYIYEVSGVSTASGTEYIHVVDLNNLNSSTTYYFIVESVDGNENKAESEENVLTTSYDGNVELARNELLYINNIEKEYVQLNGKYLQIFSYVKEGIEYEVHEYVTPSSAAGYVVYINIPGIDIISIGYGPEAESRTNGDMEIMTAIITQTIEGNRITNSIGGSVFPDVSWSNNFVVVYSDGRDGEEPEIYTSIIDATGTKIGDDTRISNALLRISYNPRIVSNGNGYGAVWSDYNRYDNSDNGTLFFASIGEDSGILGDIVTVTVDSYGIQPSNPDIVWNGNGYAVTWSENRSGTGGSQIYLKLLDINGAATTGDIKLTQAISSRGMPSITWNGSEYGIVWQDLRDAVVQTDLDSWSYYNTSEIYFTRVDSEGNKIGGDIRVTTTSDTSSVPEVYWNGSSYDVLWVDYGVIGIRDIYFAKLDNEGNKILDDVKVTSSTSNSGDYIAHFDAIKIEDGYVIAYERNGTEIKFIKTNDSGLMVNEIVKVETVNQARFPRIIEGDSSYGVVYMDDNNGGEEIYFVAIEK